MSDTSTTSVPSPSPVNTNPTAAGNTTSEYHTTKLVIYMGIASMVVGFAMDVLTALQVLVPTWAWIGAALMIAGKATSLLKALGYDATRASIKTASIEASGVPVSTPSAAAANLGAIR